MATSLGTAMATTLPLTLSLTLADLPRLFSPEVIKNFKEEAAINIVSSTLHDNSGAVFYNPSFNPIDKIVELYERMIKEKDLLIDKLLKGKN